MSVPKLRFKEFKGEWEEKKLKDVFTIKYGKDYKHLNSGNIPVIGTGGIMTYVDQFLYDKPSVLIGRKGTIDKPQFIEKAFWTVDTLFYTEINREFLHFFTYLLVTQINWYKFNEATGVPSLNTTSINNVEVFTPTYKEQTKIADFLMAVDEKIAQLTQKCKLLARYKKGVMQQIFSQELRFKDDGDRDFPDWEEKTFSQANIKVIDGDRGENYPNGSDFSNDGYCLFLNAKNVTKSGFVFNEVSFVTKQKDESLRKGKLIRSDLIITTRGTVGNIAYFDKKITYENIRINSGMVIIRNDSSNIEPNYLYKYFYSPRFRKTLEQITFGSAQPQLTVAEINKFKIDIPMLKEQTKIANFLTSIDEKITEAQTYLDTVKQYKQGLLQQMFV